MTSRFEGWASSADDLDEWLTGRWQEGGSDVLLVGSFERQMFYRFTIRVSHCCYELLPDDSKTIATFSPARWVMMVILLPGFPKFWHTIAAFSDGGSSAASTALSAQLMSCGSCRFRSPSSLPCALQYRAWRVYLPIAIAPSSASRCLVPAIYGHRELYSANAN